VTVCDCCKRENVPLGINHAWFPGKELCNACLCVWYDAGGSLKTWAELAHASLESGNKWFKLREEYDNGKSG
jgi:hypothetical protein